MVEEADRIAEEAFTNYKDKTDEIFGEGRINLDTKWQIMVLYHILPNCGR